jgi:hypothetical protein
MKLPNVSFAAARLTFKIVSLDFYRMNFDQSDKFEQCAEAI